ncbi:MAG: protein kinase [Victivallales bacterium]|nr:protein kinase [Victivallales bacterium]
MFMIVETTKRFGLEILQFCGSGAYGEVYYCKDLSGKKIALKVVPKAKLGSDWQRELRGITNYRRLTENTPGLLKIYQVSEDDEVFYYTMEPADPVQGVDKYVPDTLAQRLVNGPLPSSQLIAVLCEIFTGITNIHNAGFAHRDIKPENILFIDGHPKLADMGLLSPMSVSMTQLAGTLSYIPPEQLAGNTPYIDSESRQKNDLYAFGKIIYSCITGLAANYFPSVPKAFSTNKVNMYFFRLTLRLCDKDPICRLTALHDVVTEFYRTVDKCLHGESALARFNSFLATIRIKLYSCLVHQARWLMRNWIVTLLLVFILGYIFWPYFRPPMEIEIPDEILNPKIEMPHVELPQIVEKKSLVVNTAQDKVDLYDGETSLREALEYAEILALKSEKPVVTFAGNYEIDLKGEPLFIRKDITIDGGSGMPRLNGSNKANIFNIATGATLTLKNMIVSGGNMENSPSIASLSDRQKICLHNVKVHGSSKCNLKLYGWRAEFWLYDGSSVENVEIYGMGALRTYGKDCFLKNISVNGMQQRRGGDLEMNGGRALNVRIRKWGDLYANDNCTIQNLCLEGGAFARSNQATIEGMTVNSGSLFVYEEKTVLKGGIVLNV